MSRAGLPLAAALALAGSAAAADPCGVTASAYGWAIDTTTGVDTRYGRVETELSFSDALGDLDFAGMGTVTAKKGPWTLIGDAIYLDLGLGQPTPFGLLFSEATADVRLRVTVRLRPLPHRRRGRRLARRRRRAPGDVEPGRHHPHGVGRPDVRTDIDDAWADPVAVLRLSGGTGRWRGSLWLDGGGLDIGEASKSTWQAMALVTWTMTDRWLLAAGCWLLSNGYRHLEVDRRSQGVPYDMTLTGPLLGVNYRF